MKRKQPKYRKHSTGVAFYEHAGKRHYLPGLHNSPESRDAYEEAMRKLLRSKQPAATTAPANISLLASDWMNFCEGEYGLKGSEYQKCRFAADALVNAAESDAEDAPRLFAWLAPDEFGPKQLKKLQQILAAKQLTRRYINAQVERLKRMFRWAVSEQLIPAAVHQALETVDGLRARRSTAKESTKRQPVPWEHVAAVLPFVNETIRDMLKIQWILGVRGKSLRMATKAQFRTDVEPWEWRAQHKTEHLDKTLVVPIGPRARAILQPRLDAIESGYIFRPQDARANVRYGQHYSRNAYSQAVTRGIEYCNAHRVIHNETAKADERLPMIPHWTPHQIRHSKGTSTREEHGLEAAQAILGHDSVDATQIYAERLQKVAKELAEKEG